MLFAIDTKVILTDFFITVIVAIAVFGYLFYKGEIFKRYRYRFEQVDAPILLSHYTLNQIKLVVRSTIDNFNYAIYTTGEDVIFEIMLSKKSQAHMLAYSNENRQSRIEKEEMLTSDMQKVVLEGDFPSYFNVYCSKNDQVDLLTILEPATMQFIKDFCKNYDIEIYHSSLYMVDYAGGGAPDDTTITEDALKIAKVVNPKISLLASQSSFN